MVKNLKQAPYIRACFFYNHQLRVYLARIAFTDSCIVGLVTTCSIVSHKIGVRNDTCCPLKEGSIIKHAFPLTSSMRGFLPRNKRSIPFSRIFTMHWVIGSITSEPSDRSQNKGCHPFKLFKSTVSSVFLSGYRWKPYHIIIRLSRGYSKAAKIQLDIFETHAGLSLFWVEGSVLKKERIFSALGV